MELLEQCQKWNENSEFLKIINILEAVPFVWVRSFQPLTALKPAPQLLQPICTQLGHPALIHLEHQIHRTAVHHIWELRVRCVGCVLLRLGAKDVPETLQPLLIDGDAGDGALLKAMAFSKSPRSHGCARLL